MSKRDHVFRDPRNQIVDFVFDDEVADAFSDMIRRSVPGYETVIPITGLLAARHLERNPALPRHIYDLGCSLGATTLAVARQLGDAPCRITAVDSSAAMIRRARRLVADPRAELVCADIRSVPLEPAAVALLNYVLQFIEPGARVPLLARIRDSLAPRGLLVISEKLRFEDPELGDFYEAAHLDYKRANGYSELEISQKRTALENVMIINSEPEHRRQFTEAGFSRADKWFQCLNWVSYLVYP